MAYFGTDSWMFIGLLNVNAILMLVVLFLVARNVVKLLLERRRKIFGARLRTRAGAGLYLHLAGAGAYHGSCPPTAC